MEKYFPMVKALEGILSDDELQVVNDALWHYSLYTREERLAMPASISLAMAYAFDWFGHNPIIE